jgi:hypothetical protein
MALSIRDLFQQKEFWIYLFLLGILLLNWPILSLTEGKSGILGLPLILVYLTSIWLVIIILLFLFERWSSD